MTAFGAVVAAAELAGTAGDAVTVAVAAGAGMAISCLCKALSLEPR